MHHVQDEVQTVMQNLEFDFSNVALCIMQHLFMAEISFPTYNDTCMLCSLLLLLLIL